MKLENIKSKLLPPFNNVGIGHAVRYGEWLFISGQIPIDKDGNIVGKNDVKLQTIQVYEIIQGMLNELGFSLDNIIKLITPNITSFGKFSGVYIISIRSFSENPRLVLKLLPDLMFTVLKVSLIILLDQS